MKTLFTNTTDAKSVYFLKCKHMYLTRKKIVKFANVFFGALK